MANNQTQVATLTSAQKAAATRAANKAAKEAAARAEAAKKQADAKQAAKPEVKAKQQETAKPVIVATLHVMPNAPTSGKYLFAFTNAIMRIVKTLPAKKQAAAARWMHGETAWRHHTKTTNRFMPQADGSMRYDEAYFTVGGQSTDTQRRAVPTAWVGQFETFIRTRDFPKDAKGAYVSPEGFNFPVAFVTDKQSDAKGKRLARTLDVTK